MNSVTYSIKEDSKVGKYIEFNGYRIYTRLGSEQQNFSTDETYSIGLWIKAEEDCKCHLGPGAGLSLDVTTEWQYLTILNFQPTTNLALTIRSDNVTMCVTGVRVVRGGGYLS